ncbi:hypothetical protein HKX69_25950 [Streptomyces argyrophyllae]|uniref:Uncharacterized protein n=1 Tax=Streptomyces argyrophylli TaxID=2726118 RepID=A0A6M4PMX5_9ACTN|nr:MULTISPECIES: hypothetical protein [Streptomyces]QJS12508.1 hypothetical protein HKX69_25950 [Streptomyces argyrophyllae]
MGRRGGPRRGVEFLALGLALPALLCPTGCTGPDGSAPSPTRTTVTATGSPTARPASDAELCARLVTYWARRMLADDTYGDYQSMGLSHGQYQILMDVVAAGRSARQRQGTITAQRLMDRQARAACTARYRHGTPSGGPWT